MTRDPALAREWLSRFEGAGLDGVVAKPEGGPYTPGKRTMVKVKHVRSADCVVAGFRWHAKGRNELVGSLLLGLYDAGGVLQHVGVTSAFTMATRKQLAADLEPLRAGAIEGHPWRAWASAGDVSSRMPGMQSRWSAGKDLSWEPLRIERVCEVKYRPHAGRPVPPRRHLPAVAPGQAAGGVHLRSARGHRALRAREGVRRQLSASLTRLQSSGMSSGSRDSCAGRRSTGTCSRLIRMRVHVLKRPRMASTRMSAS